MTTSPLGPDINAYGTYARVEALADWMELASLAGRRVMGSQLADIIEDNGWLDYKTKHFDIPGTPDDCSVPEEWADAVRTCLMLREALLGDKWPFEISGNWRLKARKDADRNVPYLAMLALTVAHAWKVPTPKPPESVLEDSVVRALRGLGITAAPVGTATGSTGGFTQMVTRAATAIGIACKPDAAAKAVSAKDEGVDTLGIIGWPSDRRLGGQWTFIGQATIAKSNEWGKKLGEPRKDHWRLRLMQPLAPQRFLVVPHHVAPDHLIHLVSDDTGLIIDRLRLTLALTDVSPEEREILDCVLSAGVDDGRSVA